MLTFRPFGYGYAAVFDGVLIQVLDEAFLPTRYLVRLGPPTKNNSAEWMSAEELKSLLDVQQIEFVHSF